jgi:CP family cyanate transporter-like MFS transporter
MQVRRASGPEILPAVGTALAVLSIVLLGLCLRLLFGSASAVITEIRRSYSLSGAQVALITTGPVVCLGLFSATTPKLAQRFSAVSVAAFAMLLVALGTAARAVPSWPVLLGGTLVAGAGIAMGNVLGPVLVRIFFPHRLGLMTGVFIALLCVSTGVGSALTVPVAAAVGGWRVSLGLWAVPAMLATVALTVAAGRYHRHRRAAPVTPAPDGAGRAVLRSPVAWAVTGYMGLQSLQAYAMIGWIPTIYRDRGLSAEVGGSLLAFGGLVSVATALAFPQWAVRRGDQRLVSVAAVVLQAVGVLGVLTFGSGIGAWVANAFVGFGLGAMISVAVTMMNLRSASTDVAVSMSAMAQTVGYLIAAAGPIGMGVLESVTGGWTVPLVVVSVLLVPLAACGLVAGRARIIGAP